MNSQLATEHSIEYEVVECVDCGQATLSIEDLAEDCRCTVCKANDFNYR
jgi:Zn ribbon nucleic-acid-binding protein